MIPNRLKVDVFIRSFFIQAAWNAERMQNIGFLFSIRRSLQWIWRDDPEQFEDACLRASSFFNTHPYMAPAIMGVTIHLEERVAMGRSLPEDVDSARTRLPPPLNALGSLWFWDHWKLLTFLICLPMVAQRDPVMILAGTALFLVSFNISHFRTRWLGLSLGLQYGEGMVPHLLRMFPSRRLQAFRRSMAFMLGMISPLILAGLFQEFQSSFPDIPDDVWLPHFFTPSMGLSLLVIAGAITVMHFRWLSVYQLLALCLGASVAVTRWL